MEILSLWKCFNKHITGNALAWVQQVQRVHEPVDLWDITFAPANF